LTVVVVITHPSVSIKQQTGATDFVT